MDETAEADGIVPEFFFFCCGEVREIIQCCDRLKPDSDQSSGIDQLEIDLPIENQLAKFAEDLVEK